MNPLLLLVLILAIMSYLFAQAWVPAPLSSRMQGDSSVAPRRVHFNPYKLVGVYDGETGEILREEVQRV